MSVCKKIPFVHVCSPNYNQNRNNVIAKESSTFWYVTVVSLTLLLSGADHIHKDSDLDELEHLSLFCRPSCAVVLSYLIFSATSSVDIEIWRADLQLGALVSLFPLAAGPSCHWAFSSAPNWIHIGAQMSVHVCVPLCVCARLFICSHIAALIQPQGKMCFW